MHPLGQLITDRMEHHRNRWSLQDVVDRIASAGHDMSKSRLGQIRNNPVKSIKKDAIFALADGLGVTPLTVANAAIESMGISTRPAEVTDTLATIAIDPSLSDQDRSNLSALVRQMRTSEPKQVQIQRSPPQSLDDPEGRAVADGITDDLAAVAELDDGDDGSKQIG